MARLHEMTDLATPLVIKTAVTLGVFAAVDGGADTVDAIAAACSTHPGATAKLVRHLVLLDLLTTHGQRCALTEMGSLLADQDAFLNQQLHNDRIHTRLELSLLGLTETIRTGTPPPTHRFADQMAEPGIADEFHEEAAFSAVYRAPALPDAVDLDGVRTVALHGDGAGVYADTLVRERPDLEITLVGHPDRNRRNLADVADERRGAVHCIDSTDITPSGSPVDLAIAVDLIDAHPDADALLLLSMLATSARRVVLVTDVLDPATTDDHDTEDDLVRLCLYGSGRRTEAELRDLITDAVGADARVGTLGWGSTVVEFGGRQGSAT